MSRTIRVIVKAHRHVEGQQLDLNAQRRVDGQLHLPAPKGWKQTLASCQRKLVMGVRHG